MFGQQQQGVSELLLGSGGLTGGNGNGNDVAIGNLNGYGNDGDRNPASALDLNDFPSLGGNPSPGGNGGSSSNSSANGLDALSRQNQLFLAHQQMLQQSGGNGNVAAKSSNLYRLAMSSSAGGNAGGAGAGGNFNMTSEDFPALPGALPSPAGVSNLLGESGLLDAVTQQQQRDGLGVPQSSSSVSSSGNQGSSNPLGNGSGMYNIELENSSGPGSLGGQHGTDRREAGLQSGGAGLGSLGSQQNNPHQQRSGNPSSSTSAPSTSAAGSALSGDYGLLGLLGVIRMSDADRNALALGSDLTSLGLNLNSPEQLYSTFASPWSDSPTTREPQYQVSFFFHSLIFQ